MRGILQLGILNGNFKREQDLSDNRSKFEFCAFNGIRVDSLGRKKKKKKKDTIQAGANKHAVFQDHHPLFINIGSYPLDITVF